MVYEYGNYKAHQELTLYKKYTSKEYPRYDNYEAINVDKVSDIPMGYSGIMEYQYFSW